MNDLNACLSSNVNVSEQAIGCSHNNRNSAEHRFGLELGLKGRLLVGLLAVSVVAVNMV